MSVHLLVVAIPPIKLFVLKKLRKDAVVVVPSRSPPHLFSIFAAIVVENL